ncbi:MAG: flagellar hook capping FlgD N-terminal domain-containing protein [Paracoccaceae bacterium]
MVEAASSATGINSDFKTFLTLLTTQLRNQDPMNPQDSTQFIAQLAQFSAVEQQVASNDKLDAILNALGGQGPAVLAPWLGARVEAAAALSFDGAPIELSVDPAPGVTAATLIVKTEAGLEVARFAADPQATSLIWDGSVSGGVAPEGAYRFTLERMAGQEQLPDADPRGYASVVEARMAGGGVELLLDSGDTIAAEDVAAIRSGGTVD